MCSSICAIFRNLVTEVGAKRDLGLGISHRGAGAKRDGDLGAKLITTNTPRQLSYSTVLNK